MFGALAVASTTFTSCKDYDDDIKDLQTQIDAISPALESTKTALQQEISNLKSELQAKDAELATLIQQAKDAANSAAADAASNATAISQEIARALAAEAALEARIDAAEKTLGELNTAISDLKSGKLDKSAFDAELVNIYAAVESVRTDLGKDIQKAYGELKGDITDLETALKKGLDDERIAREAVAKDLEEQVEALKKLDARVKAIEGDYLKAADKEALETKIKDAQKLLQDQIDKLQTAVGTNTSDINTLKDSVKDIYDKITEINGEIAVLNVFVSGQLRSLVFKPQVYYWGVEAMKAANLKYVYITDPKWKAADADTKEAVGYDECKRYAHTAGSTAKDLVAHYHMNPSIADVPDDVTVLDDDKTFEHEMFEGTRTSAAKMSVKEFKKSGSELLVTYRFADPDAIKSVADNQMITVCAAEAHYATGSKDTVITSDYAAVYKATIDQLVLSHVARNGIVTNTCDKDFGNDYDNLHSTVNCTLTNKTDLHLMPSVYEAMKHAAQDEVKYNETLDLNKLVETHYFNGKAHALMSATDLKDYGLEYRFELTASYEGSNKTSEAAHAAIKDGILRPQYPQENGKSYSWEAFDALNANLDDVRSHSVGRQPIVRVTLVDVNNNNRVLDYGYIKVKITDKTNVPGVDVKVPNMIVSYTGDPINYKSECVPAKFTLTTTWARIEYDVLRALGMTKDEFDSNYDRDGQLVISSNGDVEQYVTSSVSTANANVGTVQSPKIGVVTDNYDANSPETSTFTWTISPAEIEKALYGKASAQPFTICVRYKSNDQYKYPDVYLKLSTGAITIERSSGIFLKADGSDRIKEYWYVNNGINESMHGTEEAHAMVLSADDPNAGSVCDVLDTRFSDLFVGNKIALASVTDITPTKDFADTKLLYDFVFSGTNVGKTFKGIEEQTTGDWKIVTWTLGLSADKKTLKATAKNGTPCDYDIAKIDGSYSNATAIKSQTISYVHSTASESMLNYAAHNKLADDVLKAIVMLKVKTNVCEHELDLTQKEFTMRFLRPINAEGQNDELEDAKDQEQILDVYDLVKLTDQRDYEFATHANYWNYYNIKSIRVCGDVTKGTKNNQTSGILNPYIYTTMSPAGGNANKLEDKVKQSAVSNNVLLRYIDGGKNNYGQIIYENLSSTVQTFTVRIPLLVEYEWGYVVCYSDVTIKATTGNAKRK